MEHTRYHSIAELNSSTWTWRIKVRVTRLWNFTYLQSENLDMILLDEQSNQIRARVTTKNVSKFRGKLTEGNIYDIQYLAIANADRDYRPVSNKYTIFFRADTIVKELTIGTENFPQHKFEFVDFCDIKGRAGNRTYLIDVIGNCRRMSEVLSMSKRDGTTVEKRELELTDISDVMLGVTLWGEKARALPRSHTSNTTGLQTYIITSTLAKKYQENYYVESTSATKIYLNLDVPEVHSLKTTSDSVEETTEVQVTTKWKQQEQSYDDQISQDRKTIAELCTAIKTISSKGSCFTCKAKISNVLTENGWSYMSCDSCNKKIGSKNMKTWCYSCNKEIRSPTPKFRLQLQITDSTGMVEAIAFDKDARTILHKSATKLAEIQDKDNNPGMVHQLLQALIGNTYIFQIKLSEYDIRQYNDRQGKYSFTTSKIFELNQMEEQKKAPSAQELRGKRVLEETIDTSTHKKPSKTLRIQEPE